MRTDEPSGKILLRMPLAMHQHLRILSDEQETSINTLLLMMIQRGYEQLMKEWIAEEDGTDG